MRNYVEVEKCVFIGEFANGVWNRSNRKRPGVIFHFFTRPTRFQNGDPEAGCDVKVGFLEPQSHERGRAHTGRAAIRDSVVGRRAKLLNGFKENTIGRPAYNFPSGSRPTNHRRRDNAGQFLPRSGSTKMDCGILSKSGSKRYQMVSDKAHKSLIGYG
jgi:hypothetical protein